MAFRRRFAEDEILAERQRIERELREEAARQERARLRLEHIRELNQQRIASLRMSGELLRQSQDLRSRVARMKCELQHRGDISNQRLSDWEAWALAEADKLDPILSGQIMSHLDPPEIPPEEE